MSLSVEEIEAIRALPKRLIMCPNVQKEKDRKLKIALAAAFNDAALAETAMRVIKEQRA